MNLNNFGKENAHDIIQRNKENYIIVWKLYTHNQSSLLADLLHANSPTH